MAEILGIGGAVFDMLFTMDHFPEEDQKTGATGLKVQCGGPCAVAMIAASKLGVPTALQAQTADDLYGRIVREKLTGYGVDISGMKYFEDPEIQSRVCAVLVNTSNAARTCIGSGTPSSLKAEDVNTELLKTVKYLHVDGSNTEAARFAAKEAHRYGIKVCFDADGVGPNTETMFGLADEVIPSERCLQTITGEKDIEKALMIAWEKYHPEVLIVTLGKKGGIICQDGKMTPYPAFPVSAIDSNGAGDVFHGAYLACRVKGMNIYDSCVFASATSAIKCLGFGAAESAPDWDTVVDFLRKKGYDFV